jgi:hypothetical protein
MVRRAKICGEAWDRIGRAFPELELWMVNVEKQTYKRYKWRDWLR